MTSRLTDLLTETAEAARDYADGPAAVAAARRTRRRRLVAVPAVAAVAVLLVFLLVPPGKPAPVTPATPAASAAPQPFGGQAVGPASMIYTTCARNCVPVLVTTGGARYTLPMMQMGADEFTLSPDGRRLGYPTGQGVILHDLTTGDSRTWRDATPGTSDPYAWSPDSGRLVSVQHDQGNVRSWRSIDVRDGSSTVVAATVWPAGLLDDGTVLYWRPAPGTSALVYADIRDGTIRTRATREFAIAGHLRTGETVADRLDVSADNGLAMVAVNRPQRDPGDAGTPIAVLILDLNSGRVAGRIDLPGRADLWRPDRLFAASVRAVRFVGGDLQIIDVDRATGAAVVVATVAGGVTVQLPGGGR